LARDPAATDPSPPTYNRSVKPPPIFRTRELRQIELDYAHLPLMERAGLAAAQVAREMLGEAGARVLVLAGPRNNGGDAFVVARWLREWFFDVTLAYRGDATQLSADASAAYDAFIAAGGSTRNDIPPGWRGALVVDGLFGIGLARALDGDYARWVDWANASAVRILALDVPSGLDADTGRVLGPCIRAAKTASFIALKPGLVTADGPDQCGAVVVLDLDLDLAKRSGAGELVRWSDRASSLPEVLWRDQRNVHKGTFGTLGIVGGSAGMIGAALLAGRAALSCGAGKTLVGLAAENTPAVDLAAPELMLRDVQSVLDAPLDALVCGPGLGTDSRARDCVRRALALPLPLLLDADALNLLAADPALVALARARDHPTLLSPHPGEAARLLGISPDDVQRDRLAAATTLAEKVHASVALKGAGTIVARPDGRWQINASGNPGLASGGTGDTLAGIIGALLAQGVAGPDALGLAVCLHGAAADALVAAGEGPLGLTAGALPAAARRLINAAAARRAGTV
jgi:hydroxyethylthiazole kinase-like uncharacterized protein yjeF